MASIPRPVGAGWQWDGHNQRWHNSKTGATIFQSGGRWVVRHPNAGRGPQPRPVPYTGRMAAVLGPPAPGEGGTPLSPAEARIVERNTPHMPGVDTSLHAPSDPNTNVTSGVHRTRAEVLAEQQFLQHKGYKITADGVYGPLTRSAAEDWRGKRNVAKFNEQFGSRPTNKNNQKRGDTAPTTPDPGDTAGDVGPSMADIFSQAGGDIGKQVAALSKLAAMRPSRVDPRSVPKAAFLDPKNVPGADFIDPKDVPNSPLTNPRKLAGQLADLEFGAGIRDTKYEEAKLAAQAPQNLADIRSWYGQAAKTQEAGKSADAAAAALAVKQAGAAGTDIISSLGGAANAGAGMIGQTTAQNEQLLRGLGLVRDQADQAALGQLSLETASQLLRQTRGDQSRHDALAQSLLEQEHARGETAATKEEALRQENFANLMQRFGVQMSAREYNAGQKQQRYADQVGAREFNAGETQRRFATQMSTREFNANQRQQHFANEATIPSLSLAAATAGPEIISAWNTALGGNVKPESPGSAANRAQRVAKDVQARRTKTYSDIYGAVSATNTVQDADGNKQTVPHIRDANQAVATAIAIAHGHGLDLRKPEVVRAIREQVRVAGGGRFKLTALEKAWRAHGITIH